MYNTTIQKKSIVVRRGDVFLVSLGEENGGSIQKGLRPCVVVQSERGNRHSPTTLVVPLSTKSRLDLPVHVLITNMDMKAGYIKTNSIALCEQIRVIDKENNIIRKIGEITSSSLQKIDISISVALGAFY